MKNWLPGPMFPERVKRSGSGGSADLQTAAILRLNGKDLETKSIPAGARKSFLRQI